MRYFEDYVRFNGSKVYVIAEYIDDCGSIEFTKLEAYDETGLEIVDVESLEDVIADKIYWRAVS